jgi:Primase C terminal 1 (PriCT-1)/Bifunctional DNA primase/polymerase, N-terminal
VRPGLDVRGPGGYIVVPPSVIETGAYEWLDEEAAVAAAPEWLIAEVFAYEKSGRQVRGRTLTLNSERIEEGSRNDTLFRYACSLRARRIADTEAWALLLAQNTVCAPPLSEAELSGIFDGAWRYDQSEELMAGMEPGVIELLKDLRGNTVVLPNDYVPFPWAARHLFTLMGTDRELYSRGGVVELKKDDTTGEQFLELATAPQLRSRIDARGRKVQSVRVIDGQLVLAPKRCSSDTATALLDTKEAADCLPPIQLMANAPVLIEHAGGLLTLGPGYHKEGGGVLVLKGQEPEQVELASAVEAILRLTEDFRFTDPADVSRAVAGFIGPTLRAGGLLPGHALINCIEADKSQTGKGYLVACQQAVHGETVHFISQTAGGVGSFDERLAAALIRARPFVAIDNVRGWLDSTYLESIMTSYETAQARVPYRGHVTVNVRRMTFQMTSNGIQATQDLANRMLITRLLHQPAGYPFKKFAEGGLLEHVKARAGFYSGCAHSVVRHWYERGKQRLDTEHSFREWVGTLDWIVQTVFALPPLLDGHATAVARAADPALSWLRAIALAAIERGYEGRYLSASELRELSELVGLAVPNARTETTEEQVARIIGKHLGFCFKERDRLQLDSIKARRHIQRDYNRYRHKTYDVKTYVFWRGGEPPPPPAAARDELDEFL